MNRHQEASLRLTGFQIKLAEKKVVATHCVIQETLGGITSGEVTLLLPYRSSYLGQRLHIAYQSGNFSRSIMGEIVHSRSIDLMEAQESRVVLKFQAQLGRLQRAYRVGAWVNQALTVILTGILKRHGYRNHQIFFQPPGNQDVFPDILVSYACQIPQESDEHFLHRLLADFGWYYRIEHNEIEESIVFFANTCEKTCVAMNPHRVHDRTISPQWMVGDFVDIASGHDEISPGRYFLVSLETTIEGQPKRGDGYRFSNRYQAQPVQIPFRLNPPTRLHPPSLFLARVDGQKTGDYIDEQGCQRVRDFFEQNNQEALHASPSLSLPTPYSVALSKNADASSAGFALPLPTDCLLVMTCLNQNPYQPVILGALPEHSHPATVTAASPTISRWLSEAGQGMLWDDVPEKPSLWFHTRNNEQYLSLVQDPSSSMCVIHNNTGGQTWRAAGNIVYQAEGDYVLKLENDLTVQSGQHYRLKATCIHLQTDGTHALHAKQDVSMKTDQSLQLTSDEKIAITAAQEVHIQTAHGEMKLQSIQGGVTLSANKGIHIQGSGLQPLELRCGSTYLQIKPAGEIEIVGKSIELAGAIQIQGELIESIVPITIASYLSSDSPQPIESIPELTKEKSLLNLRYQWPSGERLSEAGYSVIFSDKKSQQGRLNESGEVLLTPVSDGEIVALSYPEFYCDIVQADGKAFSHQTTSHQAPVAPRDAADATMSPNRETVTVLPLPVIYNLRPTI